MDYKTIIEKLFTNMTDNEQNVMREHEAANADEVDEQNFIGFMICFCLYLYQTGVLPKFRYKQGKDARYYAKIAQILTEQRDVTA